ncbi:MAG: S53 family peptidase [Streptosporangiales bacterium]|nr:S53 family peptidase [Streptosporangiales bacterium]MBO0890917.1 S53 family peptidase [Acidothermales bacterium]
MPSRRLLAAAVVAVLVTPVLAGTANAAQRAGSSGLHAHRTCTTAPTKGHASCYAEVLANSKSKKPHTTAAPNGYGPADIQSAYALPSSGSDGRTVAIVDAYDDPTAEQDLGTYRKQFGLSDCTSADGCFTKVDQNGGTNYPRKDAGWATEISLDLDMVSAACPDCHILLVEADSASFADLGAAVNQAASQQPAAISNSYGGGDAADSQYGSYYDHKGIAVTASTGDSGYQGGSYPASSSYVTAVGGTSLSKASNARGWNETAWSGAGSGCSQYNTALPGAANADTGCDKRAMADVSAVADPNTGVAVYDSTPYQGRSGWAVYGGTSASSPIVAGVFALAGDVPSDGYSNALPYAHADQLFDTTSGSNGSCPTTQWCNARQGWDGPTGLGTPNGPGAF